MDAPF